MVSGGFVGQAKPRGAGGQKLRFALGFTSPPVVSGEFVGHVKPRGGSNLTPTVNDYSESVVPQVPPETPPNFLGYPRKPKFLHFSLRYMFTGVSKQSSLHQHHSNLLLISNFPSWSDVDEENSVLVLPETCFLRKIQGI